MPRRTTRIVVVTAAAILALAASLTMGAPSARAGAAEPLTVEQNAWLDARERTVSLSYSEYPPYLIRGEDGGLEGFGGDLVALLEERLDITIEVEPAYDSFADLLTAARLGKLEILPFVERTAERERYLSYTEVAMINRDHLFIRSTTSGVSNIEDLLDRRIGVVGGYAVIERLRDLYPDIDLVEVNSELDGLLRLTQGEIDGMVAGLDIVFFLIRSEQLRGIELVERVEGVGVDELRFATPMPLSELRDILDVGLASIEDDELAAIRARWVGEQNVWRPSRTVLLAVAAIAALFALMAMLVLALSRRLTEQVRRRTADLQTESALHRRTEAARATLERSVEQAADVVVTTDPQGCVEYVNPAFSRITGSNPRATVGQDFWSLFTPVDAESAPRLDDPAGVGTWTGELTHGAIHFAGSVAPVSDEFGRRAGFVATLRDVGRERELQEALVRNESLAAVGALAAGVAHDFNNMLTPILGCSNMLIENPDLDAREDLVQQISQAALRARGLVDQLRLVQGLTGEDAEYVAVGGLLNEVCDLVRPALPRSVALEVRPLDEPLVLYMPPTALHQVVTNIVTNAVRAVDDGPGSIEVRAERIENEWNGHRGTIRITVTDDGPGFTDEALARAFEPYYSSRRAEGGSGLGLATVRELVERADGKVRLGRAEPHGAIVEVDLPERSEFEEIASERPIVPTSADRSRVAVVDDHGLTREVVLQMVEHLGHTAVPCRSAQEARALLDRNERVDLVITDLAMPSGGGAKLARWIERHAPTVPIILLAGHEKDQQPTGPWQTLFKPISLPELEIALAEALGTASATGSSG